MVDRLVCDCLRSRARRDPATNLALPRFDLVQRVFLRIIKSCHILTVILAVRYPHIAHVGCGFETAPADIRYKYLFSIPDSRRRAT